MGLTNKEGAENVLFARLLAACIGTSTTIMASTTIAPSTTITASTRSKSAIGVRGNFDLKRDFRIWKKLPKVVKAFFNPGFRILVLTGLRIGCGKQGRDRMETFLDTRRVKMIDSIIQASYFNETITNRSFCCFVALHKHEY